MREEWAHLEDWPNYAVSNFGEIKNINTGKLLRVRYTLAGDLRVNLSRPGEVRDFLVRRLVAMCFFKGFEDWMSVEHVNGDNHDCRVENLRVRNLRRGPIPTGRTIVERRHARPVRIVSTGEVFSSAWSCAQSIGGDPTSVYKCLRGERATHLGLRFEYAD